MLRDFDLKGIEFFRRSHVVAKEAWRSLRDPLLGGRLSPMNRLRAGHGGSRPALFNQAFYDTDGGSQ